jgi:hypothetical protein
MIGVMWVVRTRAKFNWSSHGNTYRAQILAYTQFSEYNWLHPEDGGDASREFMYAFDPKGRDYRRGDTQTFDWYKTAYRLATTITALPYEQMPREWRRLDSFVSVKKKRETMDAGDMTYKHFRKEVDGNAFGSWMVEDDIFWNKYEGFQEPGGWQP